MSVMGHLHAMMQLNALWCRTVLQCSGWKAVPYNAARCVPSQYSAVQRMARGVTHERYDATPCDSVKRSTLNCNAGRCAVAQPFFVRVCFLATFLEVALRVGNTLAHGPSGRVFRCLKCGVQRIESGISACTRPYRVLAFKPAKDCPSLIFRLITDGQRFPLLQTTPIVLQYALLLSDRQFTLVHEREA